MTETRKTRRSSRLNTTIEHQDQPNTDVKVERKQERPSVRKNQRSSSATESPDSKRENTHTPPPSKKRKKNSKKRVRSISDTNDIADLSDDNGSEPQNSAEMQLIEGLPCSLDMPPKNYEQFYTHPLSIMDSSVLYNALQQSRKSWFLGEMFKKYWSRSRDGSRYHLKLYKDEAAETKQEDEENNESTTNSNTMNNNNGSMHKFADCTMVAGPHSFSIKLFILKNNELEELWKTKQDNLRKEKEEVREKQRLIKLKEQEDRKLEIDNLKKQKQLEKQEREKMKKQKQEERQELKRLRSIEREEQRLEKLKRKEELQELLSKRKEDDLQKRKEMMMEKKKQKELEKNNKRQAKLKTSSAKNNGSSDKKKQVSKSGQNGKPALSAGKPITKPLYTSPEEQKMIVNLNAMAKSNPELGKLMLKLAARKANQDEVVVFKKYMEKAKEMDFPDGWKPVEIEKGDKQDSDSEEESDEDEDDEEDEDEDDDEDDEEDEDGNDEAEDEAEDAQKKNDQVSIKDSEISESNKKNEIEEQSQPKHIISESENEVDQPLGVENSESNNTETLHVVTTSDTGDKQNETSENANNEKTASTGKLAGSTGSSGNDLTKPDADKEESPKTEHLSANTVIGDPNKHQEISVLVDDKPITETKKVTEASSKTPDETTHRKNPGNSKIKKSKTKTAVIKEEVQKPKEDEHLSLFQQKYADSADLLIEFDEHTTERYLFPKDSFIEYNKEENVYTVSWMVIHNASELSKYCGKMKLDFEYKINKFTLFPLKALAKGPVPLYSCMTIQLHNVPKRFSPIILNSRESDLASTRIQMETVLKRGQRLSGYNLWYQIDAFEHEELGETLRSSARAYERLLRGKRTISKR